MDVFFGLLTDLLLFGGQGWIFYHMVTAVLGQEKGNLARRAYEFALLALPFFTLRMFVSYSPWIRELLYGNGAVLQSSKSTILSASLSFLVLLCSGLVYGKRQKKTVVYLVVTYTAVSEMLRFAIYCLIAWIPNLSVSLLGSRLERGGIGELEFYTAIKVIQDAWLLLFLGLYLCGIYLILQECAKYLVQAGRYPRGAEFFYLLVPAVVCLGLGILLRSIWLFVRDGQLYSVFEENPLFYGVVPGIAFCGIFLVLFCLRMRCRLIQEEEEACRLLVYQNQVEDMGNYIRDLEGMQEGLKGMRHDMKNYMADIHALLELLQFQEAGPQKDAIRQELSGYVQSMEKRLDQLQIHYKTGNPVTDVIINRFRQQGIQEGITAEFWFCYPMGLSINPFDLSIILNNAWNNAMEACRKQPEGKRFISLQGVQRGKMFFLRICNSMEKEDLKSLDGFPVSTKPEKEKHGIGMKNIAGCVKKYGGHMDWKEEGGVFSLTVLLQQNAAAIR